MASGTVPLILPGGGCALPGLQAVPVVLPGGGCALPGLQDPLTDSRSVGPRKRSAAGRWHQARYP
ncbi:hypothetical protein EA838_13745 [Klebsiella pneumoniae]|nr:hypothetical protein EA838_13745 [Klebsiella pneumoniae]